GEMGVNELFLDDENRDSLLPSVGRRFDAELVKRARRGPLPDCADVDLAIPLARLVHDELQRFGTDGSEELDDEDMRDALRSLLAVADRLGITNFNPEFRDFGSFKSWWLRMGASGSWQGRRDLLPGLFEPLPEHLALIEQAAL